MKTYNDLYARLCSYENLELAFKKARKGKTLKNYVIGFEADLKGNLSKLQFELQAFTYQPAPIKTFIVSDPKTRKIGASDFRDRVVHHALYNVISPILGSGFIFDSFANRKGKGTHNAIRRFESFLGRASFNHHRVKPGGGGERVLDDNAIIGYAFKADIKHYFETIDHGILLRLIRKRIKDEKVMWLIETILKNYRTEIPGKGMPLGNLTSQFFANFYLNELDYFVKHRLNAGCYIRYVDDFLLLHQDKEVLSGWKEAIDDFLGQHLEIELHPEKSRIIPLKRGVTFLGFRVFAKYRLLKKSNARRIWKRLEIFKRRYDLGEMKRDEVVQSLEGWFAYAEFADTYDLRRKVAAKFNDLFGSGISR